MTNRYSEISTRVLDASVKTNGQATEQANDLSLVSLSQSVAKTERDFKNEQAKQGPVGNSVDWLKNNLGTSPHSEWMAGRLWSSVLNSDNGSIAVQKNIDADKRLLASVALSQSQNPPFDPQLDVGSAARARTNEGLRDSLTSRVSVNAFEESQRFGMNVASDLAALSAVILTRRPASLAVAALEGAAVKSGTKYLDGAYSNPKDDATAGAMLGVGVPIARAAGFVTGVGTKMIGTEGVKTSIVARYGAEGAVLGYSQEVSSRFSANREAGKSVGEAMNDSLIAPYKSGGVATGLALGIGFGFLAAPVIKAQAGAAYEGAARRVTNPELGQSSAGATDLSVQSRVANPSLMERLRTLSPDGQPRPVDAGKVPMSAEVRGTDKGY